MHNKRDEQDDGSETMKEKNARSEFTSLQVLA